MGSPADGVLPLENTCAAYERFSLVKVVYGHRKALVEGLKVNGCSENDFTDVVKRLLPDAFQNGEMPTYDVPISAVSPVSDPCPSSDVAWFVAWNCSPDTSIAEERLPISCNLYSTTGAVDDNQHSCACPNSAQACGADAATVSGNWIKNLPAQASVSLANFLMYKTTKMGYGAIVVVDGLNSVCAEGPQSYVLCEDDRSCRTACGAELDGQCANAVNPWLCVSASLSKCYIPNTDSLTCHIETPGPEDESNGTCMCKNSSFGACTSSEAIATTFAWESTLPQFVAGKKGVIVAKYSRALWATSPPSWHYEGGPRRGKCEQADWIKGVFCLAANLAASWLLASGVEAEVRFASPVVPTPVVFIGASRPIGGLPKFVVSQVTSESFKVQLFGGFCGVEAVPASPELKLVTSYLALPPGEYLTKHSSLRLVIGSTLITSPGDAMVQVPFVLSDPSKLFDPTEITGPAITLPSNLPSLFQPHFFPQVAGRLKAADTVYSLQWQEGRDQSWTPLVWGSRCNSIENLITKVSSSDVKFTGLYIAARIYLLYCFDSTYPLDCIRALLPADFNTACILLGEDQPVEGDSDETDVEDGSEEIATDLKCKVFDMRNYSANLAWDSLTFTCACPGQSPACSQTAAARDLTWLKQLHEEGGLCEVANGAIKPVIQQFYQLSQDACSLAYVQDASLLAWSKRAYPAYPDFSGPGSGPDSYSGAYLSRISRFFWGDGKCVLGCFNLLFAETAADEDEDTGVVAPQGPVVPPSCFAGEWGEWSVCDATCLAADQNPQRIRRRSPLVAVHSIDSSTCALEEKESCGGSLAPCSSYCWSAPWTEWAECAELLVADKLVNARRRYRPIFAGAEFCDLEEIQEIDICHGGRALEIDRDTASGGGFTEILSLQQSQAEMSEWSGCDVPCLMAKGHQALKRKLQRTGDAFSGTAAAVLRHLADSLDN
ncbi:hypothetical protein Emag_006964 [Eimeria magna]